MSDNLKSNGTEKVCCICRSTICDDMIMCDNCKDSYQADCCGVTSEIAECMAKYCCSSCMVKDSDTNNSNYSSLVNVEEIPCVRKSACSSTADTESVSEFVAEKGNSAKKRMPASHKLSDIKRQLGELKRQFDNLDIKTIGIIYDINMGKREGNNFKNFNAEDVMPVKCVLCEDVVEAKNFKLHFENCYKRLVRKSGINECEAYIKPSNNEWLPFCNYKIAKKNYCHEFRFLCPLHYKDYRKKDERCGYPLTKNNSVTEYCGNIGKTCCHENWEERLRLKMDVEKIPLITKFYKLQEAKVELEKECKSKKKSKYAI